MTIFISITNFFIQQTFILCAYYMEDTSLDTRDTKIRHGPSPQALVNKSNEREIQGIKKS